jgi:hypothetical protein
MRDGLGKAGILETARHTVLCCGGVGRKCRQLEEGGGIDGRYADTTVGLQALGDFCVRRGGNSEVQHPWLR